MSVNDVEALCMTRGPATDQPLLTSSASCTCFITLHNSAPLKPDYFLVPNCFISVLLIFAHTALPSHHSTFSLHNLFSIKFQPRKIECCYICAPSQTFCTNFFISLSCLPFLDCESFKGRRVFQYPVQPQHLEHVIQSTLRKMYVDKEGLRTHCSNSEVIKFCLKYSHRNQLDDFFWKQISFITINCVKQLSLFVQNPVSFNHIW